MKVCYVTHLPNLTGANQSLLDLLRALEGTEVEPYVLMGRHGPLEEVLEERNIPYQVIRYANELKKDNSKLHTLRKDALNLWSLKNVESYFQAKDFDLVHNNSMFVGIGMEAAQNRHIPYVAHIRDYVEEDHGFRLEHPKAQSKRVQKAGASIAVSKALQVTASGKYHCNSIQFLYDAVDVNRYYISPDERELPLSGYRNSEKPVELLLAGRIAPGKGQLDAVLAMKELSVPAHLTIVGTVGNEEYAVKVQDVAANIPDKVTILPFVEDLKELRKQTDIALVCSSCEAMGRVTVESMLAGCLVIGADGGATPELLEEGRGLLYPVSNVKALAECITSLTEKPAKDIERMVSYGQAFAKDTFSIDNYAEEILRIYHRLVP